MTSPWELPDLVSLRLLVEVVDRQSIGAAARHLGMSQPAASERLAGLERRLGVPLCVRGPTGARPTPAGEVVRDWAAEVLQAAERLTAGAATLRGEGGGEARVVASLTVADYLVPAWLHALRRADPRASLRLEVANSAEVVRVVEAGEADLGFVEGGSVPASLAWRIVGEDELVVAVTPAHPWARRRPPTVRADELARTPLVVREHGSGTREVLERALRGASRRGGGRGAPSRPHPHPGAPPFAVAFEVGSTRAIKAAVRAGDGPAVVSALAVAEEVSRGELVAVGVEDLTLTRRLRAIWPHERPPSGTAGALLSIASRARPRQGASRR